MARWRWGSLVILSLVIVMISSYWIRVPGYMDSEYYFTTARELVNGSGFREPYLWNYLDDPEGIPHPSHLYWMPFTTLLSAVPMLFFGGNFRIAQAPFILLSGLLPLLAAFIALRLHGNESRAWYAGLLATFPGFYLPFFLTTDTFVLFAFVGGGGLWLMAEAWEKPAGWRWFLIGILIGFGHLIRADGPLLFAPAIAALFFSSQGYSKPRSLGLMILGYALIMTPWIGRNMLTIGNPLPPSTQKAFWLLTYDEIFSFPASMLTPSRWLQSGLASIARVRFDALWTNLQRLIGENGLVFLGPFMLLGLRAFWNHPYARITVIYLLTLLFAMSFIFPFAGAYGGFFHSSTALMPALWAFAPLGIEIAVKWAAMKRGWIEQEAQVVFATSAIVLAGFLTVALFWTRTVGPNLSVTKWEASLQSYQDVGQEIWNRDSNPGLVAINNPPGFYLATDISSIVIPNGPDRTLLRVIEHYGVDWVVLDANRPTGLAALYDSPLSAPWLDLVSTVQDAQGRPIFLLKVVTE